MNKATVDSVMAFVRAVRVAGAAQIIEPCEANIGELEIANAALRAEVERLAAQAEPAPEPVGEYPALPQGRFSPDSGYTAKDMRAYLDADRAQRQAREVRLLTGEERFEAYDAMEPGGMTTAEAIQCKFCEVNGLTIKEQS